MQTTDVLVEAFGRVHATCHRVLDGISEDALAYRPDDRANSAAWLLWHLARVQDDHVSDLAGRDQIWLSGGWSTRFGLPFDKDATGYGQDAAQVAAVTVTVDLLGGYLDQVNDATVAYLNRLGADDLESVIDASFDPAVTVGVRLVSVLSDDLQHVGQASYVRGLAERA